MAKKASTAATTEEFRNIPLSQIIVARQGWSAIDTEGNPLKFTSVSEADG